MHASGATTAPTAAANKAGFLPLEALQRAPVKAPKILYWANFGTYSSSSWKIYVVVLVSRRYKRPIAARPFPYSETLLKDSFSIVLNLTLLLRLILFCKFCLENIRIHEKLAIPATPPIPRDTGGIYRFRTWFQERGQVGP